MKNDFKANVHNTPLLPYCKISQEPHYAVNSKIYLQPAFKIVILSQVNNLNMSLAWKIFFSPYYFLALWFYYLFVTIVNINAPTAALSEHLLLLADH